MIDGFDIIAVRIYQEGGVVAGMVIGAFARGTVVLAIPQKADICRSLLAASPNAKDIKLDLKNIQSPKNTWQTSMADIFLQRLQENMGQDSNR